jgi:uncharacterized membrane protein
MAWLVADGLSEVVSWMCLLVAVASAEKEQVATLKAA